MSSDLLSLSMMLDKVLTAVNKLNDKVDEQGLALIAIRNNLDVVSHRLDEQHQSNIASLKPCSICGGSSGNHYYGCSGKD